MRARVTVGPGQLSNWERYPLTDAQRSYAAADAWVSAALFQAFDPPAEVRDSPALPPPPHCHSLALSCFPALVHLRCVCVCAFLARPQAQACGPLLLFLHRSRTVFFF